MISGVLSMTLVSHVSFSIKYAYSSNYETNIAEKTKWITIIIIIIIIIIFSFSPCEFRISGITTLGCKESA